MQVLLTQRAADWLSRHRWPRLTAVLLLSIAVFVAIGCWYRLQQAGIGIIAARVPLSFLAGYIAYLAGAGVWYSRFPPIDPKLLLTAGASSPIDTFVPGDSQFDEMFSEAMDSATRQAGRDSDNVLGFLVTMAVFGFVFVAIYYIYHAPYYLAQLLVHGGKIRHRSAPAYRSGVIFTVPLQQSAPIATVMIIHYSLLGLALQLQ